MRGIICVERFVNGRAVVCPLDVQWAYKEWYGCFSLL